MKRIEFPSGNFVDIDAVCLRLDMLCPYRGSRTLIMAVGRKADTPDYGRVVVWLEYLSESRAASHGGWAYTSGDSIPELMKRADEQSWRSGRFQSIPPRAYALTPITEFPDIESERPWHLP